MEKRTISETALFLRLKRWFSRHYREFLHKTRPGNTKEYLANYFTVDEVSKIIVDRMLDLEVTGRQKGVLKKGEEMFKKGEHKEQNNN